MKLFGPINSGIAAGGAGVAGNNATTAQIVRGNVIGIYVRYNDACPATTDVIIKTVGTTPAMPTQTLLTLTNKNTSGLFLPRALPQDTSGANLAALTIAEPNPVFDNINVAVAQANDADSIDVWLFLE
jgi:hypothetical protein